MNRVQGPRFGRRDMQGALNAEQPAFFFLQAFGRRDDLRSMYQALGPASANVWISVLQPGGAGPTWMPLGLFLQQPG